MPPIPQKPPSFEFVTLEVSKGIALIKYNRPKSGNSLHRQVLSDMLAAVKWADAADEVRVIIQSGEGKFFSTGMELVDVNPSESTMDFSEDSDFWKLNRLLINSRKILVAAVNGPAAGWGVTSLALFDLVYSVPEAYFFTPFVKWGWAAEGCSSFTFPRIMGHQKAASLFLAAERATAQELERVGLVSKIIPSDGFLQEVMKIAGRIAESPVGSLFATKELMRGPVRDEMLAAIDRECQLLQRRPESGEPQEAMKQFAKEQERKKKGKDKSKL